MTRVNGTVYAKGSVSTAVIYINVIGMLSTRTGRSWSIVFSYARTAIVLENEILLVGAWSPLVVQSSLVATHPLNPSSYARLPTCFLRKSSYRYAFHARATKGTERVVRIIYFVHICLLYSDGKSSQINVNKRYCSILFELRPSFGNLLIW